MQKQNKYWRVQAQEGSNTAEIFLYGYIGEYDVCSSDFVKELRQLEALYSTINVRINSGGGNVFEGLAMYNAIKMSKSTIDCYNDGICASMATIILAAGRKSYMSKSARAMTHQPSSGAWGNAEELQKNAELLKGTEKIMLAIYASKTGKTEEECRTLFMNGQDTWFDADQFKEAGMVDEIYDADPEVKPAEMKSMHDAWAHYDLKFAAVLNPSQKQIQNMEMKYSAAVLAALNITGEPAPGAVEGAINNLMAKAALADTYKSQLDAANQKIANADKAANTEKVTAMLTAAKTDKKISEAVAKQLAVDYDQNPDGLKTVLDGMQPHKTIVSLLNNNQTEETDETLAAEWDKLDRSKGGTAAMKATNMDRYKMLYKAKFGKEYSEK